MKGHRLSSHRNIVTIVEHDLYQHDCNDQEWYPEIIYILSPNIATTSYYRTLYLFHFHPFSFPKARARGFSF